MATHGAVAKAVRLHRERRPERYCSFNHPPCLYRTDDEFCEKHRPPDQIEVVKLEEYTDVFGDAYTATGRRPNQKALRAKLSKPYPALVDHLTPPVHEEPQVKVDGMWVSLA